MNSKRVAYVFYISFLAIILWLWTWRTMMKMSPRTVGAASAIYRISNGSDYFDLSSPDHECMEGNATGCRSPFSSIRLDTMRAQPASHHPGTP